MSSLDQDDELDEQGEDDTRDLESPPSGLRAWTARASSYVVSKMVLLEQLSEGVGGYLLQPPVPPERTEFSLDPNDEEGTTSGATSGDDIWGTPTSGGPDDESFTANSVIMLWDYDIHEYSHPNVIADAWKHNETSSDAARNFIAYQAIARLKNLFP